MARAASGEGQRAEGGELGVGREPRIQSGFGLQLPGSVQSSGRLSGDVEAAALAAVEAAAEAARAGGEAEREELQDLVPRSRVLRPSPDQSAPSYARRLLSSGASRCALRQPHCALLGGD